MCWDGRKVPFVCNEPGSKGVLLFQAVPRRRRTAAVNGLSVRAALANNRVVAGRIGFPTAIDRVWDSLPDREENRRNRPPGRRGFTSLVRRWAYL